MNDPVCVGTVLCPNSVDGELCIVSSSSYDSQLTHKWKLCDCLFYERLSEPWIILIAFYTVASQDIYE